MHACNSFSQNKIYHSNQQCFSSAYAAVNLAYTVCVGSRGVRGDRFLKLWTADLDQVLVLNYLHCGSSGETVGHLCLLPPIAN